MVNHDARSSQGCTPRVLIVDDHTIVALGVAQALEKLGFEVVGSVPTGEEAIRLATEQRPDFIIMDVNLGAGIDGIAAAIEIRHQLGIRSVFFTGYDTRGLLKRAAQADPIAAIDKANPVSAIADALEAVWPRG